MSTDAGDTRANPFADRRYLVGGAVRDALLDRPRTDRDWLVPGASAADLLAAGFRQVGRHFPVYLAPDGHEEHALPRGVADGGSGDPLRDLRTDLERRDFTVNAMAVAPNGRLVDPHDGQGDVRRRTLRHVRARHFLDDPVRCLRAARLAAELGFSLAPETRALVRSAVVAGALQTLPRERVLAELDRGLAAPGPGRFVRELRSAGILAALLPEVDRLFGIPQPAQHHPEVDTGIHVLHALDAACRLGAGADVRMAVLLHDVGKGVTDAARWPAHVGHEGAGVPIVDRIAERLGLPTRTAALARLVTREHLRVHRAMEARPATLMKILVGSGALRDGGLLEPTLLACEADARGRLGLEGRPYPQADWLRRCAAVARSVGSEAVARPGLEGRALGEALHAARTRAIAAERGRARDGTG